MASFVLIPGAGGSAWYWHRVTALLQAAGHESQAVDLPGDDPDAGLPAYAAIVTAAIGARKDVVLVAQSLGGFTAPLIRQGVGRLVLVNAMIPVPGETAGAWWEATGAGAARQAAAKEHGYSPDFDLDTYFLHDVPRDVAEAGAPYQRPEAEIVFKQPCAFTTWPAVPLHVATGADDRFFPAAFQQRIARERLGVEADLIPGGHLNALSRPRELTERLLAYLKS